MLEGWGAAWALCPCRNTLEATVPQWRSSPHLQAQPPAARARSWPSRQSPLRLLQARQGSSGSRSPGASLAASGLAVTWGRGPAEPAETRCHCNRDALWGATAPRLELSGTAEAPSYRTRPLLYVWRAPHHGEQVMCPQGREDVTTRDTVTGENGVTICSTTSSATAWLAAVEPHRTVLVSWSSPPCPPSLWTRQPGRMWGRSPPGRMAP